MKVTLLNQYYAPDEASTAQLLGDLGAALAARGHRVRAVCSNRSYADPGRRYPARETLAGVEVRRLPSTAFGRSTRIGRVADYAIFGAGAAGALLGGPRPDVVVSLSTPPLVAALGLVASALRGSRTVYWVMDVYPDLALKLGAIRPRSAAARVLAGLSRRLLSRSDRVVALDEAMAGCLRGHGAQRVTVIPNWADEQSIRPRPTAGHPLRESWGWDGRFVVLYSGNMGLAHEFDTLLDAARRLSDDRTVLFAFVGGGPRRREIEDGVARRELANVEFRPYVPREQLGESLTAGDLHVVTLRDGMQGLLVPSKIYGILAAGRPTLYVGPAGGEVYDVVSRGCGAEVRVGDADSAARAIERFRDDRQAAEQAGRAGRALLDERFTRAGSLARFVELVEGLAAAA